MKWDKLKKIPIKYYQVVILILIGILIILGIILTYLYFFKGNKNSNQGFTFTKKIIIIFGITFGVLINILGITTLVFLRNLLRKKINY
jgi:hypothetical protein